MRIGDLVAILPARRTATLMATWLHRAPSHCCSSRMVESERRTIAAIPASAALAPRCGRTAAVDQFAGGVVAAGGVCFLLFLFFFFGLSVFPAWATTGAGAGVDVDATGGGGGVVCSIRVASVPA